MEIKPINVECYRVDHIASRIRSSGERTIIATLGKVKSYIELPNGQIIDTWASDGYGRKICEIPANHPLAQKVIEAQQNNYRVYTNISQEFQEELESRNGQNVSVYYHRSIRI